MLVESTELSQHESRDSARGLFVSDLHLFSPRSDAHHFKSQIIDSSTELDCLILGGDIFDFRWSDLGGHLRTLEETKLWLEEVLSGCPLTQVVFLPGNHDCHPDFLETLQQLQKAHPHFLWRPHHLRIGDQLFLHGDLLDAGASYQHLAAYRAKFHHTRPQPQWAHRSYDMAVGMRVHKVVPQLRHRPKRTCARLLTALRTMPLEQPETVREVYFGHTHVPIAGLQLGKTKFFNPGAGLRHMHGQLLRFTVDPLELKVATQTG